MNYISYVFLIFCIPIAYWGFNLCRQYFFDGADRRVPTTICLYVVAILQYVGHTFITLYPALTILFTIFLFFLIPHVFLKNHFLFYTKKRYSQKVRFLIFVTTSIYYLFIIWLISRFEIISSVDTVHEIITEKENGLILLPVLIESLFLLVAYFNGKRKLKTMIIYSAFTLCIALRILFSYIPEVHIVISNALYYGMSICILLILYRNYTDIILDSKEISFLYEDARILIRELAYSEKKSSRKERILLKILKDKDLSETLLHSFSLTKKIRDYKKYLIEKLG